MPTAPEAGELAIRLGVSACLLGRPVRWDGASRGLPELQKALAPYVEWVEVCPEAELGLGVPRPPIELRQTQRGVRLLRVEDGHDLTGAMDRWSAARVRRLEQEALAGYICKARSPSCGAGTTPLRDPSGGEVGRTDGRFIHALAGRLPLLPVADESLIHERGLLARYVARVVARARLPLTRPEDPKQARQLRAGARLQLILHGSEDAAEGMDWTHWRAAHAAALARPIETEQAPVRLQAWAQEAGCWEPGLPRTWDALLALRNAPVTAQPDWCREADWFRPHPLERRWPPQDDRTPDNSC